MSHMLKVKKHATHKWVKVMILMLGLFFIIGIISYAFLMNNLEHMKTEEGYKNWTRSIPPLNSSEESLSFIVEDKQDYNIKLWWEGLTGKTEVIILDEKNEIVYQQKSRTLTSEINTELMAGQYKMLVKQSYFTGAIAMGFEGITISHRLDDQYYTYVHKSPDKGFNFDYILYIPEDIKYEILLVVPNNTGKTSDNYNIHIENAKGLAEYRAHLADRLGVSMLIPVFPRPSSHSEIYTHALDRKSMTTKNKSLNRLDLQLISMVADAKSRLKTKNVTLDSKIIMAGFSASGNFVDRFSFLHPDKTLAISAGASDNILPLVNYNNVNLPYPIGLYDYKALLKDGYDLEAMIAVKRFYYKGAEDEGGWMTTDVNGQPEKYTWIEYYNKYLKQDLKEDVEQVRLWKADKRTWSDEDLELVNYLVYDGKLLLDRFNLASEIHKNSGFENSLFKVYENTGHTITEAMIDDEVMFFKNVLEGNGPNSN